MGILYHAITNKNYVPEYLKPTTARADSVGSKEDQKPKTEGVSEDVQQYGRGIK